MITRTIVFRYRICCYDVRFTELSDCERYQECSEWEEEPIRERQDDFDDSLVRWADNIERELRERIVEEGDSECAGISEYHEFCSYELEVIEAANEAQTGCPEGIRKLYNGLIEEADKQDEDLRVLDEIANRTADDVKRGLMSEEQREQFMEGHYRLMAKQQAINAERRIDAEELLNDYPDCR